MRDHVPRTQAQARHPAPDRLVGVRDRAHDEVGGVARDVAHPPLDVDLELALGRAVTSSSS
ncbi:hypothetical protein A8L33_14905 (plasmid) [Microbacterium aurantiacum]|nr:hypothetical protein A8L33_14905 [Microbacterium chocolatum]